MYEQHFGLRQRPFRLTPDAEFYYPATTHEHALGGLLQAIAEQDGLIGLCGDAGLGKTLAGYQLFDRLGGMGGLGDGVNKAFLTNSHCGSRAGLLQAILFDLALPYAGLGEQELRLALTEHLLQQFASGKRTLLIVDESHRLSVDLLEELRLLTNLEGRQGKAIQVVLLAQPQFLETLKQPELASFRQRMLTRFRLEPFALDESVDYLMHQVRAAGGKPESIVTAEALETLACAAGGVPRNLNQVAHRAFCVAQNAGLQVVDVEAALEALTGMDWDGAEEGEASMPPAPVRLADDGPTLQGMENGDTGVPSAWPEEEQGEDMAHVRVDRNPHEAAPRYFALPRRPA